jgi:protease I
MAKELEGVKVAFLVANEGVERLELVEPWKAVEEAGGSPELIAPRSGKTQTMNHLDKADQLDVDKTTQQAHPDEYDAFVLPGGVANPDQLRMDKAAVAFIRSMIESGKPGAVICHGPWTLVEADCVRGRTITSWPSLQTDIRNAGGTWVDSEVQVCDGGPNVLVTSRKPDDLPAFCKEMTKAFARQAKVRT